MISLSEADHEVYLSRRKYLLDEQSRREEGLEEGVILGRIQMLESLLGLAPSPIGQFKSETPDELLQIEAELKAKLANRS